MSDIRTSFTDWDSGLQHWGVLGMKWGQRRYQNKDGSLTALGKKHYDETGEYGYTYKSHTTKKYTRKAEKAAAQGNTKKAEKFQLRANRSKELDAREQEYAQRVRAGGNIAFRLLTDHIGGKAYQQHLAMNKDTTSFGSRAVSAILSGAAGRVGSMIRKAMYLRQDERAARRAAKGKASDRGAAFREKASLAKAAYDRTKGLSNVVKAGFQDAVRGQNYTRYMTPEERRRKGL